MAKIDCPYCPESDCVVFGDTDELNVHILREHPEKTSLAETVAERKIRMWSTAENLTSMSFNCEPPRLTHTKEDVLERFKYFLTQLMESGL